MKPKHPLISVILPVYNAESFLRNSIFSILDQTLPDFELIVIDDGSTDSSLRIIQQIQDSRIVLISRENRGLPSTLNEGISLAKGNFIARMDADDISLPNRFEKQYLHLCNNPEIDILGTQALLINENNLVVGRARKPCTQTILKKYIKHATPALHPTFFLKKSIYEQLGGYQDIRPSQDYDFLCRANDSGFTISNTPETLMLYRIGENKITTNNISKVHLHTKLIQSFYFDKKHISGEKLNLYNIQKYKNDTIDTWASRNYSQILKKISNQNTYFKNLLLKASALLLALFNSTNRLSTINIVVCKILQKVDTFLIKIKIHKKHSSI